VRKIVIKRAIGSGVVALVRIEDARLRAKIALRHSGCAGELHVAAVTAWTSR